MRATGREKKTWIDSARLLSPGAPRRLFYAVLLLLPLLTALICMAIGRYEIDLATVLQVLAAKLGYGTVEQTQAVSVVWTMRLPRVLLAMLVGGGLAAAGAAFQSLFANPLATPDTLGVAAGSSFGAVLALFFGFDLLRVQMFALITGFGAVALTYLVSRRRSRSALVTVVLAGLVISSLFSALVSLVKFVADTESQLPSITYWLMGSLQTASFRTLPLGAPFILAGAVILFALRWRLNILPLSDDEARATGTNIRLLRMVTALAATMITAACVSLCGQVGWVGLLVPHICRMALGSNNLTLIPSSLSLGAVFMLVMDTLARSLTASEIPISILTALIGAPFFIMLLRRTGGWNL